MDKNVGGYDRLGRFVVGPVLLVVGIAALGGFVAAPTGLTGIALAVVALLVGAVLLTTAITQKCPLNSRLGLDTYTRADDESPEANGDMSDTRAH